MPNEAHDLVFEAPEVLDRVNGHGDLFAPVLDHRAAAARAPGLIGRQAALPAGLRR